MTKRALVTAPTIEPVTLAELKAMVRVTTDDTAEDTLLTTLISVAREHLEKLTWRKFIQQTWDYSVNQFVTPVGQVFTWDAVRGQVPYPIYLPFPPVSSITSITYLDVNGTSTTLATTEWELGERHGINVVRLKYGKSWPAVRNVEDAVTIRMVCGYGAATTVPAGIKHAILLLASHLYSNREPVNIGNIVNDIPWTVEALINPFRIKTRV
jgi:uncharacterized phiE125 gp8 family phage protein